MNTKELLKNVDDIYPCTIWVNKKDINKFILGDFFVEDIFFKDYFLKDYICLGYSEDLAKELKTEEDIDSFLDSLIKS